MRLQVLVLAAAAALLASGCDRDAADRNASPQTSASGSASGGASVTTPTTPANAGQPASNEEKKEGANPQQGQVDPKQPEQHRDFQQKGDQRGPTSPETQPRRGG